MLAIAVAACSTSETLDVRPASFAAMQPDKYAAIVIDASDGRVLFAEQEDQLRHPASLAKMMTLHLLFDALESGRTTLSSSIPVSSYAASRPASKLYLKAGETISVDLAIRALAVKSANDVATAVAEYLAGSESAFAAQMTARARSLGMASTVFTNASGLPDPQMVTTARDMARLSLSLRRRHGAYYHYFALTSFEFRGNTVTGHNKVLEALPGADGLKTGYIKASGFNLATSVRYRGKSLIGVVMGGSSGGGRDRYMMDLMTQNLRK